jgi:hypothetical protein
MNSVLPAVTKENEELTNALERLRLEFLELFTRHKDMVENDAVILTSLYLEKLGRLQLELLEKQTEAARLKMKMNLMQAAINRNEKPDPAEIQRELNERLEKYYSAIKAQAAALDDAKKVLSHLISEEDARKLKELFRVLCKRLHPDLNPNQTEEEKDLFIKVKAAYDLQMISDLQNILLYLDDSTKEDLLRVSTNDKLDRIKHLESNIAALQDKIERLKQSFPFTIAEQIYDETYVRQKQEEILTRMHAYEEQITNYSNIIYLMSDE